MENENTAPNNQNLNAVNGEQNPNTSQNTTNVINEVKIGADQAQNINAGVDNKSKLNFDKYTKVFKDTWLKLNPQIRKVITVTGFIFGILILLAIVFSISTRPGGRAKATPTPMPNSEQSPLPEIIINPSKYATDSAVLLVEENIKKIEKEIGETVINDLKLSQPNLLWDINFED
jgi:hypothetical protein